MHRGSALWKKRTIVSTNSVFCQVSVEVGAEKIVEVAHRMGIKSPLGAVPAIVLGAPAVSPLEMAAAFSTLANYGLRVENYLIERIEDGDGNVVYQHQVEATQVLEPALSGAVVQHDGAGHLAGYRRTGLHRAPSIRQDRHP